MAGWSTTRRVLIAATLLSVLTASACALDTEEAVVEQTQTGTSPRSVQCAAPVTLPGDGLTIQVINRSSYSCDKVHVFVQQGSPSPPTTVYAPTTLDKQSSWKVQKIASGAVVISLGDASVEPPPKAAPSPDTSAIRFDQIELSYSGDAKYPSQQSADMTSVQMFGIPLDMTTRDSSGQIQDSRVWRCYTDKIKSSLKTAMTNAGGDYSRAVRQDSQGNFLRLVSPNITSGLNPSGYPDFKDYVSSIVGQPLTLVSRPDSPVKYHYTGAFKTIAGKTSITLHDGTTKDSNGNLANKNITIDAATLPSNDGMSGGAGTTNAIYSINGPYYLGDDGKDGPHFVAENDVHAAAYRDLIAGFDWGFWGSQNSAVKGNDSSKFVVSDSNAFASAQPSKPYYNIWAAALFPYTDSYGFPFADTFNPNRNPLLPLPVGGTLQITIQPDTGPSTC